MSFPIAELPAEVFPAGLREIPQPPKCLNYRGRLPPSHLTLLSVVGPRKYSSYGKEVVGELISGLKNYSIGIVSGLAIGMDSLVHEAALRNNLYTLAIPGGGISDEVIYPTRHLPLARRILECGGCLLSEFEPGFRATKWSFPQRNRLVAGISQATLLVEAASKSGTLITARMTVDYNRELMVVPGNIFHTNSEGVHQFLKLGATPVTESGDILEVLGITPLNNETKEISFDLSPTEKLVFASLENPIHRDELTRRIDLPVHEISQLLMLMELEGKITSNQNIYRKCLCIKNPPG